MTIKIVIGVLITAVIVNLFFAIKTKHPIKVISWSGGLGMCCVLIFSLTEYFFDIGVKFNLFTLVGSFFFGIPGVITMLITNVVWNI